MTCRFLRSFVVLGALGVMPVIARAQNAKVSRPIELGVDAGVTFTFADPHTTTVSIPVQSLRAGFFVSNTLSIEPAVSLMSFSGGGVTVTTYDANVGAVWHMRPAPVGIGPYVRPFVGFTGISGEGSSDTRATLGGGVGVKIPMASRLATRLEANYTHIFGSNGDSGDNALGLMFGLSFFTR